MKKIKENNTMDEMVKRTQVYLNAMYGGNSGYEVIPENGITGWTTIYALTRALQIELLQQQIALDQLQFQNLILNFRME